MSDSLVPCPGRNTYCHNQFLHDFDNISDMRIVGIDVASADFMYASGSTDLVFCTNERYILEMHKLLTLAPAHRYIRDCWEKEFDNGHSWHKRCRKLAAFNNRSRRKVLRNWNDVVTYYCILAMSSFSYQYKRWRLVSEHVPMTPDYDVIKEWGEVQRKKEMLFYHRNIYRIPTRLLDDRTLLYIHLPNSFAAYGCGYVWSRRKLEYISNELNQLAKEGYKICISARHMRLGHIVNKYPEYFDPDLFTSHYYTELKADRHVNLPDQEVYLIANL